MGFHHADRLGKTGIVTVEASERDEGLGVGRPPRLIVDEQACDIERNGHAEARADEMEHEVERRRCAASGEDRSIDDIAVGADIDIDVVELGLTCSATRITSNARR